jgi:GDP-L-fucose synthase
MKKILVTGASSFLGHHVMPLLSLFAWNLEPNINGIGVLGRLKSPRFEIFAPNSKELNLLNRNDVINYMMENKPDTILHMAALCGGIGANKKRPGEFILDNTKMAINIFDAISEVNLWSSGIEDDYKQEVTHFYGLGSVCAYPKYCPVPFKEDDIWNGFPEETNAPYGIAKRHLLVMQDSYRRQFGLKGAHLIPVNLFGSHDHFDLENSHVIPALINKFVQAKNDKCSSVQIWGDGTPTREFLYAKDCAKAIVKSVISQLDYDKPINIGTGRDISIKDLANLIKDVVGFDGELEFTGEISVNGQPQRRLDVSRAKEVLDFVANTDLRTGLEETVAWYVNHKGNNGN